MSEQNEQSQSFEQSMARLEQIVRAMERGDVPLEESLKLFEEGTALVRRCSGLLDGAELQIKQVMKGPDGAPVEVEFGSHEGLEGTAHPIPEFYGVLSGRALPQ